MIGYLLRQPVISQDIEYNDTHFEEKVMRSFGGRQRVSGVGPSVRKIGQEMYTSLEEFHTSSMEDSVESSSSIPRTLDNVDCTMYLLPYICNMGVCVNV